MERKKEKTKKGSKPTSPDKTIGEMASDVASKKRRTRQPDATVSLPLWMFLRGQEPCKKKVNSYFSLSYLEVVKKALEEDQLQILLDSQFSTLLGIGNKISFSVKFAHFLLCRQLVTKKTQEIWVLFGGQPIRFSIREFALATNLNGIASLMLMLLHVHNKLNDNIGLTRTQVVGASNHYVVDLFHTVMKGLPH